MYLSALDIQYSRLEALGNVWQVSRAFLATLEDLTEAHLESTRHFVQDSYDKQQCWLAVPQACSSIFQAHCLSFAHAQQACLAAWDTQVKLADSLAFKVIARAGRSMPAEGEPVLRVSREWLENTEQLMHAVTAHAADAVECAENMIVQSSSVQVAVDAGEPDKPKRQARPRKVA